MSPDASIPIRVMVQDAWDQLDLDVAGSMTVNELKQKALGLTHIEEPAAEFAMKFRGAELLNENQSLSQAGVVARASLIVVPRRRRPVR